MKNEQESAAKEAERLGISRERVRYRRKVAAGLCGRCPISRPRKHVRAGLCQEHYDDHLRRSRERMAGLWAKGRHPDQLRRKKGQKRK